MRSRLSLVLLAAVSALSLAGCGNNNDGERRFPPVEPTPKASAPTPQAPQQAPSTPAPAPSDYKGASNPTQSINNFLNVLNTASQTASPDANEQRQREIVVALCARIDPRLHKSLEFTKSPQTKSKTLNQSPVSLESCGAGTLLSIYYPGENASQKQMDVQSMKARVQPSSVKEDGTYAVAAVTITYKGAQDKLLGTYVVRVLATKHDGRWWFASPVRLNSGYAMDADKVAKYDNKASLLSQFKRMQNERVSP